MIADGIKAVTKAGLKLWVDGTENRSDLYSINEGYPFQVWVSTDLESYMYKHEWGGMSDRGGGYSTEGVKRAAEIIHEMAKYPGSSDSDSALWVYYRRPV